MTLPGLTETVIRQHTLAGALERGREILRRGAVGPPTRRGRLLQADVEVNQPAPLRVRVGFDAAGVTWTACTCLAGRGGWCEHVVAVLLACLERPEAIEERPTIEDLLAGLDPARVQELVVALVAARPDLYEVIERLLASPGSAGDAADAKPAATRRSSLDVAAIRREVRAAKRNADRQGRSGDSWYPGWNGAEIGEIVARARGFLDAGDVASAFAVLMAVSEETIHDQDLLEDENGYNITFFAGLGAAWTEAILSADLTAEERASWVERLEEWIENLSDYGLDDAFPQALEAAEQGWDDPLQRVLAGEPIPPRAGADDEPAESPSHGWGFVHPTAAESLAAARLRVLDRQGRNDAYLNLAAYEGLAERRAGMLVRLGRLDEAVAEGLAHFRTTNDALSLAAALRERGAMAEALRVGEHGLTLRGQVPTLATWLRDLAAGLGETDRALAAATAAFGADPNLANYLRAEELAGVAWPELRQTLLAKIRGRKTFSLQGPVEVLLHEGLVADTIELVDGSYDYHILATVAEAAIASHPDWVIATSQRQAEGIMDAGKADRYHHAATWLGRAKRAYAAAGRPDAWSPYLEELIAIHERKYKLRPMLEALR